MSNTPDVPVPAGATADDWPSLSHDGVRIRSLTWSTHDTAKCSVQWKLHPAERALGVTVLGHAPGQSGS